MTNEFFGFRDFFISLYFFDCRSVSAYLLSFIDCVVLDATLLHVKRSSLWFQRHLQTTLSVHT